MRSQPITTVPRVLPVAPQPTTRDQRGLLDALAVIDHEGWDSEAATALLTYIRHELVRPGAWFRRSAIRSRALLSDR